MNSALVALSSVSAFKGTLNGIEVSDNAVFIDELWDPNSRNVHLVVSNVKLNENANQIIKSVLNAYAEFELQLRLN
jgi:hypothetical protein